MNRKLIIILCLFILVMGVVICYVFFAKESVPKCDSKYAENQILSIFETQSRLYDSYKDYIDHISLEYPQATSYEENIDKYSCKGVVTFHAKEDGEGFQYVSPWGVIENDSKYSQIECPVTYTIVKSRDDYIVQSTLCGWADIKYNGLIKNKKDTKEDNYTDIEQKENNIYKEIGVSKECFEVWQIIQAEGYYPGEKEPDCSQEDIDKIDKYCENNDACFE